MPDKGGDTPRQHIAGALARARDERRRRALAAELDGPPLGPHLRYLWSMFGEIAAGLDSGGFGPAVVTWRDIESWSRLTATPVEPFEALMLARLGQARAIVMSDAQKRDNADPRKNRSG